ncbi:MAG: metallophosphoesterase [Bdellovibrionia bacterium]
MTSVRASLKRFFSPFLLAFTAIILGVLTYVALRASTSVWQWLVLFGLGALFWTLPAIQWRSEADLHSRGQLLLQQASYLSMGFLSWMLVITVIRDLSLLGIKLIEAVSWAAPESASRLAHQTSGVWMFAAAGLCTLWGILVASKGLRIREVRVPVEGLPRELEGFKIAQISDLHVGPTIGRDYVEKVVGLVSKLKPDLTVLTGDIVDGNIANFREAVQPFTRLVPQGKVYFAPGNHEYYWDIHLWLKELSRLGIKILLNQGEAVEARGAKLWVGGVTDPAAGHAPSVEKASQGSQNADFKLLLSHRPEIASDAKKAGFDLQLSGHTHGGQFFPWTIVVKFFHEYVTGLYQDGSLHVYVSPGTGTWGPPIRVGTTPELTCIELLRKE